MERLGLGCPSRDGNDAYPGRDFIVTSRMYQRLRIKHAKAMSKRMKLLWQDPVYREKILNSRTTEQRRADALVAISRPDVQARRAEAYAKRGKHSEVTKQRMRETYARNNGTARKYLPPKQQRWVIKSPEGETFSHTALEDFCRERALYYPALRVSNGLPVPMLQRITPITNPLRQQTTGWSAAKR